MTDEAQVQPAEPAAPTTEEPSAPAVPPEVIERLDKLDGRFDQLEPLLQPEPQLGYEPEPEPYGQGFQPQPEGQPNVKWLQDPQTGESFPVAIDPQQEQYGDPYAQGPQGLDPSVIDQRLQEAVSPLAQRLDQYERQQAEARLDAVVDEFPALKDDTAREEFAQHVAQTAAEAVQGLPRDQAERRYDFLCTNPTFVRNAYLAKSAGERAAQGAPAGDQGAVLEGASGANPGPVQDETPVADQIVAAAHSRQIV